VTRSKGHYTTRLVNENNSGPERFTSHKKKNKSQLSNQSQVNPISTAELFFPPSEIGLLLSALSESDHLERFLCQSLVQCTRDAELVVLFLILRDLVPVVTGWVLNAA
jgi:hypothetical protein